MATKIYNGIVLGLLCFIAWQLLSIKLIELQGFNGLFQMIAGN